MIQIGEFFLAELLLGLSTIAFIVQIIRWTIDFDSPLLRISVRSVVVLLALGMNAYLGLVTYRIKGDREWSNLSRPKDGDKAGIPGECADVVHGPQLLKYADKYNVVLVCGIADGKAKRDEDFRISVGPPRLIQPSDMTITAPYSESMKEGLIQSLTSEIPGSVPNTALPKIPPWYEPILLLKNTNIADILRLSDVRQHGYIISEGLPLAGR